MRFHGGDGTELAHHVSLYRCPSLEPIEVHQRRIQNGSTLVLHVTHETGFVKLPVELVIVRDEDPGSLSLRCKLDGGSRLGGGASLDDNAVESNGVDNATTSYMMDPR